MRSRPRRARARRTCSSPGSRAADRRRLRRARRRAPPGDRARHGRHELRRLPDPRRRAALLVRLRARVRLPGQRAERLDADDRRGRRLDRLGRPRRLPPGRARRARAPCPDPPATARAARRRRSPTRTSCSAASIPPSSSAASSRSTRRSPAPRSDALGARLGLDEVETASAMVRVCNENMANAIRIVTVEQGIDPRDLRARRLRRRRRRRTRARSPTRSASRRVARPARARACAPPSARSRRACGRRRAQRVSHRRRTTSPPSSRGSSLELEAQARADFAAQGLGAAADRASLAAMRYQGQNYEQEVRRPGRRPRRRRARGGVRATTAASTRASTATASTGSRSSSCGSPSIATGEPPSFAAPARRCRPSARGAATRDVFFPEHGLRRRRRSCGARRSSRATSWPGPLIVEFDGLDRRRPARLDARGPASDGILELTR